MLKTYYLAKIISKLRIPSFNCCEIDRTAKVSRGSVLVKITMGKYSYIGADTYITDAVIGNFCSIAGGCNIGGGIHPINTVSTSPVFFKGNNFLHKNFAEIPYKPSQTVVIGSDVWIGEKVYIKAGVSIGTGAIIGAHAVVTKDVAPYTIVAGVPAKVLRKRFEDDIIEKLLQTRWWEKEDEEIRKFAKTMNDPELLLKELGIE